MSPLSFSLQFQKVPVSIDGTEYTLQEMTGQSRDLFLDDMTGRFALNTKGEPIGISNNKEMRATLVALCLRDSKGEAVPTTTIQSWPAVVVEGLYKAAQELNKLNKTPDKAEAEAKKD